MSSDGDRAGEGFGFHRRQNRQGDFRADAGDAEEKLKDFLVVGSQKAEQGNFFGPHMEVNVQKDALTDGGQEAVDGLAGTLTL